ncbi:AMP-binding protein [Amycolatopsis sp. SID8362]|uniref:AMP-binding protein n=1 Tax=Amycolatopsis sp. SID8362 TaxID=2690346 RepID=UPI001367D756|nr:AMP-binding protein [Amycolatopsis sp. SID8362]NBH11292.1 AMP-binding protein [Amycolatopsis sp. SID8362]NED47984.1 AMP-binding protein [Amycolatopsis sp. SID8362]
MKRQFFAALERLADNDRNDVVYRDGGRVRMTWAELARDIDRAVGRLAVLRTADGVFTVGLIGPTSYEWMVLDLACVKAGFRSVAVPEFLTGPEIAGLLKEAGADVVLADRALAGRLAETGLRAWYVRSGGTTPAADDFDGIEGVPWTCTADQVLDHYSIGYSSGTSGVVKRIDLTFPPEERSRNLLGLAVQYYRYRTSFWSRKDNKLFIFMPFSHLQQRAFVRLALMRRISIVLSDPGRCIQDLIVEKPNIMVSVPMIYEALATRIEQKLAQLNTRRQAVFRLYLRLGINRLRNGHPVKRLFGRYLFAKVRKVYGGRADYFVTGSAPIDQRTLTTFHRVGVKIYEGYGQSELPRIISMSSEKDFRIGSVGKPRVPVKIGADGEILVKIDRAELATPSAVTFDPDGYIHTGDLGHLDRDGFLFIDGRKDDVIVLDNGKKVFPAAVETVFRELKAEDSICVTSFDGKRIAAVAHWPAERGGREALRRYLAEGNPKLPEHEKVTLFAYTEEPFTEENGLLTGTRKLRRRRIRTVFGAAELERVDA